MTAKHNGEVPARAPESVRSRGTGRLAVLAASLLVAANLCIFGTFEIHSANRAEFDLSFGDVAAVLTALCLGLAAVLAAASLLVPARARRGVTAVLLAIGVLLWVQGGFLRWGYGELDGTAIDWAAFRWQGWVDAAVWVVVLAAAVRFRGRVARRALFVAGIFLVLQCGVVAWRAVSSPDTDRRPAGDTVPQALCQLSNSLNVFHFIMDSFQSDVFMDLVSEEGLAASLDGFTVYRANVSTGGRTVLSVPATFSTNVYDGTESESEYFRKALGGSFHNLLFENGYVVNLMPHVTMEGTRYTNYFMRPATYGAPRRVRLMRTSSFLVDVSLFRQSPQVLKRAVYNDQNWRLSSLVGEPPSHSSFYTKAFFRDYIDRLEASYPEPAYHFVHMMPPHAPFVTMPDGSYAGKALPHTRENYKNEARYVIRLFMDFVARLKELDLYDSSVVLLHGDHGMGIAPEVPGARTTTRMGRVSALLLLKPPSARGPLRTSWAQTSLSDIPATLMGLLGIPSPYPGEPIVGLDPSRDRSRRVVFVTDRSARQPTVHRWIVRGNVYDARSWHGLPPRKVERRVRDYPWGTPVKFGISGDGDVYLGAGWSTTSPTLHWNDGKSAEMILGIREPLGDVSVQIVFFPYVVPGKVDRQRVRVSVNGHRFGEVTCVDKEPRTIREVVPNEVLRSDRMEVLFEFPDAVSPSEIGEGRDTRSLAMGLYEFEAVVIPGGGTR